MNLFALSFILYFIEGFILWHYCTNMFRLKYSGRIALILAVPLYIPCLLLSTQHSLFLNAFSFLATNFIYIYGIFTVTWHSALFHSVITTSIMSLAELAAYNVIPSLIYNLYLQDDASMSTVILSIFSKLIYFLILQSIIFFFAKSKERGLFWNKGSLLLFIIPVITLWITISFMLLALYTTLSPFFGILITISSFLLLVINLLVFHLYRYNQKKEAEYREMQLQLQKERAAVDYYKLLLEENETKSILIHDIKKHLTSIALLNEQGNQEKISAYIHNIISSSSLQTSARICDNDMLNAILCRYVQNAAQKKVVLRTDIRSGCLNFMTDEDLTTLFCNLLDNAMTASALVSNGFIELSITPKADTAFTVLTLTNSCQINPFDGHGKLATTKSDKSYHGYGMKSVARIAGKYGGEMNTYFDEESNTFHTIILMKNS